MIKLKLMTALSMLALASTVLSCQVINLPKPNLPFSDGVVVGNTLYISGESAVAQNGKLTPGGITPETRLALNKIKAVVEKAGFQMKDVVSTTVYLSNMADFTKMNAVYQKFFPTNPPARVAMQVVRLFGNAHVEISAIAVK